MARSPLRFIPDFKAASRKACRLFSCHFAGAGKNFALRQKAPNFPLHKTGKFDILLPERNGMLSSPVVFIFNSGKGSPRRNGGLFSVHGKKDERCRNGTIKNFEKVFGALRGHSTEEKRRNAGKCLFIRHNLSNIHRRRKMIRRFFEKRRLKLYREMCYNTLGISKRKSGASYDALTRCRKTVLFAGPSPDLPKKRHRIKSLKERNFRCLSIVVLQNI